MSLHVDGAERTRRTQVLACAAPDAPLGIDGRNPDGVHVAAVGGHHQDSPRGTMAGAVAALHTVGQRNAVLPDPYGMTDAGGGFLLDGDRSDGSRRADLRTPRALRTAVASFVGHFGLHQLLQIGRRAQHAVGTDGHAELAAGAVVRHVAQARGAGRDYNPQIQMFDGF